MYVIAKLKLNLFQSLKKDSAIILPHKYTIQNNRLPI